MTNAKITPVILCGGSGARLWPLSRKSFPKQFVPLVGNKSLLQLTLERVAQITGVNEVGYAVIPGAVHEAAIVRIDPATSAPPKSKPCWMTLLRPNKN